MPNLIIRPSFQSEGEGNFLPASPRALSHLFYALYKTVSKIAIHKLYCRGNNRMNMAKLSCYAYSFKPVRAKVGQSTKLLLKCALPADGNM
jgi:hypothetical protein